MSLIAAGRFNYVRAFEDWCFVQLPPLDLRSFQRAAEQRGLRLPSFERDVWEALDREDLLPPIAYALYGFWLNGMGRMREEGSLLVRDEVGFIRWDEIRERAKEYDTEPHALYAHWQLLTLAALVRLLEPPTPWRALAGSVPDFERARRKLVEHVPRDGLLELARTHRRDELVLARVQNFFFPRVRGGRYRGGVILGLTEDAAEWVDELERSFDFAAAADECGINAEGLSQMYSAFVARGRSLDPLQDWFHLADQVRRDRREKLKGDARLALDYYDAARIIRGWHASIADEPLADVDEVYGMELRGAAKERMYGTADIRNNREALPPILEAFGLYPWRVQLVTEGQGEVAILDEILRRAWGLTLARLGIHAVVVGTANIPEHAALLLAAMRPYANYYFLLFDNEGRARQLIDELRRGGHVEGVSDEQRKRAIQQALEQARAETYASDEDRQAHLRAALDRAQRLEEEPGGAPEFFVWSENIEADNFDVKEIVAVVQSEAARDGVEGFSLDVDLIRAELDAELAEPAPRGIARIVLEAAERSDPPFVLDKTDLDRALGGYAVDNPERRGQPRKILVLAEHLVRLTVADRRLAGRLRKR